MLKQESVGACRNEMPLLADSKKSLEAHGKWLVLLCWLIYENVSCKAFLLQGIRIHNMVIWMCCILVCHTCRLAIVDSDQTSLTFWLVKAFHLLCIALPTICCKLIGIMTNQARVNCQVTRVMVCCFHFLKLPLFQWPFVPRNVYRLRYTEASCPERLYLSGFCWAVAFLPSITPCNIANSWSWMLWCLTV